MYLLSIEIRQCLVCAFHHFKHRFIRCSIFFFRLCLISFITVCFINTMSVMTTALRHLWHHTSHIIHGTHFKISAKWCKKDVVLEFTMIEYIRILFMSTDYIYTVYTLSLLSTLLIWNSRVYKFTQIRLPHSSVFARNPPCNLSLL